MLHFPYLILKMGKWGSSGISNIIKWGISRKKHVIDWKTRKEPKMYMLDFGAFQEKMHVSSGAKFVLHILFGPLQVPVPSRNLVAYGLELACGT